MINEMRMQSNLQMVSESPKERERNMEHDACCPNRKIIKDVVKDVGF